MHEKSQCNEPFYCYLLLPAFGTFYICGGTALLAGVTYFKLYTAIACNVV
jgi:hypothetical protein